MDFPPFFPGPVDKHMCTQTNRHVHVNVHTMKDKMEVKNEVRREKLQLTGLVNIGAHQLKISTYSTKGGSEYCTMLYCSDTT